MSSFDVSGHLIDGNEPERFGGEWFSSVGTASTLSRVTTTALMASAFLIGTGGIATPEFFAKSKEHGHVFQDVRVADPVESGIASSPMEQLESIRLIFKPTVAELAGWLGVSRQTIYNWYKGSLPSDDLIETIDNLAAAGSVLKEAGIVVTPYLLRRKLAGGRTLLQNLTAGVPGSEAARAAALMFVREAEQQNAAKRRLGKRVGSPEKIEEIAPHLNET